MLCVFFYGVFFYFPIFQLIVSISSPEKDFRQGLARIQMHRTSFTQPRIQQPFVSMERGVVAQVSVWCAIDAQIAGFFVDDSQQINGQVGYPRTKACVVPVEKGSEVRYKSYGQQAKEVDGIDEVEYINIYYIIYKSNIAAFIWTDRPLW